MSFGFPASYETEIEVTAPRQAIREAIGATLELLGWDFSVDEGTDLFTAQVRMSLNSWGQDFVISLAYEPSIRIRSSCKLWQVFDWGANKRNVERFLKIFWARLSWVASMSGPPSRYLDEALRTPIDRVIKDQDDTETYRKQEIADA